MMVKRLKILTQAPQTVRESSGVQPTADLSRGLLDPDRLHFYGHSVQLLSQAGPRWVRVHSDWSITVGTTFGQAKIPTVVLCSRDRRGAWAYIGAVCSGRDPSGVDILLDDYDKELVRTAK
jgi:hypothetical protein